jgi:DNA-binding response OmpR family regulator
VTGSPEDETLTMQRVLIVEDEMLIAVEVEAALQAAGYDVCGIATSEAEAVAMARAIIPHLAVVDVNLAPGDGKNVARELADKFNTTILMATSDNPATLNGIGASAVLPKPYDAELVPSALEAAQEIAAGGDPGELPDHMRALRQD